MTTITKSAADLRSGDIIAIDPQDDPEIAEQVRWTVCARPTVVEHGRDQGMLLVPFVDPADEDPAFLQLDPAATVEVLPPEVAERAEKIAAMRELIDFLEATPDLPIGWRGFEVRIFVRDDVGDDAARKAEIDRIADLLGVEPLCSGHYQAEREFGSGARYEAIACGLALPADETTDEPATDSAETS